MNVISWRRAELERMRNHAIGRAARRILIGAAIDGADIRIIRACQSELEALAIIEVAVSASDLDS